MRLAHLTVGLAGLLAFVATGPYMRHGLGVSHLEPVLRALYRSSHLYIFLVSALNVFLGCYFASDPILWRRVLQGAGSAALLLAVPVLLWAFFVEPGRGHVDRPVTSMMLLLLLPAILAHLIPAMLPRRRG